MLCSTSINTNKTNRSYRFADNPMCVRRTDPRNRFTWNRKPVRRRKRLPCLCLCRTRRRACAGAPPRRNPDSRTWTTTTLQRSCAPTPKYVNNSARRVFFFNFNFLIYFDNNAYLRRSVEWPEKIIQRDKPSTRSKIRKIGPPMSRRFAVKK